MLLFTTVHVKVACMIHRVVTSAMATIMPIGRAYSGPCNDSHTSRRGVVYGAWSAVFWGGCIGVCIGWTGEGG